MARRHNLALAEKLCSESEEAEVKRENARRLRKPPKPVKFTEPPTKIADWDELAKVPPTAECRLEIEEGCGWIVPVDPEEYKKQGCWTYLSSHTFYGSNHESSTRTLQKYGFNVVLANWDE